VKNSTESKIGPTSFSSLKALGNKEIAKNHTSLFNALLMSYFQNFAADAIKKIVFDLIVAFIT